ncbi:hypothetical protein BMB171_C3375 [Bacillus thuringiensis BMB171]|nr:hypothetical protein BMB171_C3375 [Bacillus thuringiensis BMB171]
MVNFVFIMMKLLKLRKLFFQNIVWNIFLNLKKMKRIEIGGNLLKM